VAALNFLEDRLWTDFPQLGCWHSVHGRADEDRPAFTLFLPNALYRPNLATNVAFWFMNRLLGARTVLPM
jgi:hypothetical protein